MKIQVIFSNRQSIMAHFTRYVHKVMGLFVGLVVLLTTENAVAAERLPPIQSRSNAPKSLERRLTLLERRLSSATIMEIMDQLEVIKREVRELRGNAEELAHKLDSIKKRQRNLYLDVDQRLQKFEGAGSTSEISETPRYVEADEKSPLKPVASPPPATGNNREKAKRYREAYETLQDRRYNTAIQQLQAFLDSYPSGEYADNAQYWLGEAFYFRRDFPEAKEAFSKVLEQHPNSSKSADALLKLGFVEYELGDREKSNQRLNEVIRDYPGSTAAKLAEKRLQQLRKKNRNP